jgi:hypothetical protein
VTGIVKPSETHYKVVEISRVYEEEIETELNRWTAEGFRFESIHFVTQPGTRRPSMAFLFFSRAAGEKGAQ